MKNILKITVVLMLLLTLGCSKEYLDPVPQTSLSDLSVFDNKDRIVAQVNGMYAFMKSGSFLGGRYFVYNDIRADNFIPKSSNVVTNFDIWNHTEVASSSYSVQNCWSSAYAAINAINVFLDGLKTNWDAGKLANKITQADYDQYRSEGLTLRALAYFDLLQLYAKPYNMGADNPGLPLRLKAEKSATGNDLARSTVGQVYSQILSDLNEAEPLAITTYGATADLLNTTRIHRNTIIALKTRVYLHMQNYAAVVTESAKIVPTTAPFVAASGVPNALTPAFTTLWSTYTTKESIFSLPFTSTNTPGTQNGLAHYFNPASSESYFLITGAGSLYATMDATDVRKTSLVLSGGNYFVGKYPDFTTLTNYAPVIRYAEVLLNRAEALVRAGGSVTAEAINLLNAVRTRSFATGAYTSFATASAFYDAILLERNMEFLGEGMRNMDLMRLKMTIPAKNGGSMGTVPAIAPDSPAYIWPIPSNESSLNSLMTPNK